jgi:hypothetical protein
LPPSVIDLRPYDLARSPASFFYTFSEISSEVRIQIWAPGISIAGLRKEGREWQVGLAEVAGAGRWQIGPAGVEKGKNT